MTFCDPCFRRSLDVICGKYPHYDHSEHCKYIPLMGKCCRERMLRNQPNLMKTEDDYLYFPIPEHKKEDVDKLGRIHVTVNGKDITVISFNKRLYAVNNTCPHRGSSLKIGDVEDIPGPGVCIRCPNHGWKFDLTRGDCIVPGNRPDIVATIYPVKVECPSHRIFIGFKEMDSKIFKDIPS